MKLAKSFVPYYFPFVKKLNPNSSILKIIKSFFIAILLSNSIYLSFFESLALEIFSPFLAIYGLVLLLRSDKIGYFWAGFFLGILWFFWLSFSSIYFGLSYLIPFEILGIGLFYGILFRICFILKFDFLRLCGVFLISFIHPLGFDWLNWGVLSVYGFFESSTKGVICMFLIAYFYYERYISRYYKIAIILALFFIGMQYKDTEFKSLNTNIALIQTHISQDQKYLSENQANEAERLINEIFQAIEAKKEVVVLPESAFAFELKQAFSGLYYELLKELSKDIVIIAGAFNEENKGFYNSTYVFQNGEVKILNKHYLVPFGEELPIFKEFVRTYLLPDMGEFSRGEKLNHYELFGEKITNAICYEATKEALYKESKIIIAISNNAWFDGFIEPSLQRLLIKFYASKYGVSVYHATNGEITTIITPKKSLFAYLKNELFAYFDQFKNIEKVKNKTTKDENSSKKEPAKDNVLDDNNLTQDNNLSQTQE
ncbi:apolipoprotein N-acyltransferase [Campylobacter sp. MIT 12-5580]|nr:apolipoprotein N-acyltransferase [Campylobacter sp. MIT 12-5580]